MHVIKQLLICVPANSPPISCCLLPACLPQDAAGESRGSGIVEFERSADALHAISMLSNSTLGGRQIHVRAPAQQPRAGRQLRSSSEAGAGGGTVPADPGARYLRLMWPHCCCNAILLC